MMMSFFQTSSSIAFASNKSSHIHTHANLNGFITTAATTTTNYHNIPRLHSLCTHRRISSIVCSQTSENTIGYMDLSSDMVIDGGMGRTTTAAIPLKESCDGIGIVKFLQGKSYLITGATGFLAKVFIEKLLRTVPDVGKIFLLIKAKDKEAAKDRVQSEIIDSELFKCLEGMHGKSYKAFMMSKLVPIVGNVCKSNLGMDTDSAGEIAKEVDVIVNSAANTTFDERYDIALNTNTRGTSRLLSFAKKCKKLGLFLHVSTGQESMDGITLMNSQRPLVRC